MPEETRKVVCDKCGSRTFTDIEEILGKYRAIGKCGYCRTPKTIYEE